MRTYETYDISLSIGSMFDPDGAAALISNLMIRLKQADQESSELWYHLFHHMGIAILPDGEEEQPADAVFSDLGDIIGAHLEASDSSYRFSSRYCNVEIIAEDFGRGCLKLRYELRDAFFLLDPFALFVPIDPVGATDKIRELSNAALTLQNDGGRRMQHFAFSMPMKSAFDSVVAKLEEFFSLVTWTSDCRRALLEILIEMRIVWLLGKKRSALTAGRLTDEVFAQFTQMLKEALRADQVLRSDDDKSSIAFVVPGRRWPIAGSCFVEFLPLTPYSFVLRVAYDEKNVEDMAEALAALK